MRTDLHWHLCRELHHMALITFYPDVFLTFVPRMAASSSAPKGHRTFVNINKYFPLSFISHFEVTIFNLFLDYIYSLMGMLGMYVLSTILD